MELKWQLIISIGVIVIVMLYLFKKKLYVSRILIYVCKGNVGDAIRPEYRNVFLY